MSKLEELEEELCNTPVLTPFALNVYDVYIVMDYGVGYRETPHHLLPYYVSAMLMVFFARQACYNVRHHVHMQN